MDSFITESVQFLFDKYNEKISDLIILLPNQRSRMFFNMALSNLIKERPVWQPKYASIDDLMSSFSGIKIGEKTRMLVELYKIFNAYHPEPFDKFYFWGEVLLSDFEMIDNYLIDARLLYSNTSDLKDIDLLFSEASQEQIDLIREFWGNIGRSRNSGERSKFLSIWNNLYSVYTKFRERLKEERTGYKGMIYREAAEKLKNEGIGEFKGKKFAVIGFNALSNSEKALFKALKEETECDFLWDYDEHYLNGHEAGTFIRENIALFGESNKNAVHDNFSRKKEINIVAAPTDSLQAKHTWTFLEECMRKNGMPAHETAVVLTDENLLLPVMYSIPPQIDKFNVTSGYRLNFTQAFILAENLLTLHGNAVKEENGKTLFHHKDIRKILSHKDILTAMTEDERNKSASYLAGMEEKRTLYDDASTISSGGLLTEIFRMPASYREFSCYLRNIFTAVIKHIRAEDAATFKEQREFYIKALNTITEVGSVFEQCGMDVSLKVYFSALRKRLSAEKVSFEGEPLIGMQVMGILETRALDFKNVLILSVNEDTFPSNIGGLSYIPYNLRMGYGLPTINHHEAMYSYYFYRLLQRAEMIDIVYNSGNTGIRSGEPSRYVHQLRYASPHKLNERAISVNVNLKEKKEGERVKESELIRKLERYYADSETGKLSPSAINTYIQCPMKFYYRYMERLETEEEISEEMDAADFGNIVHHTLQEIYMPLKNKPHEKIIDTLKGYDSRIVGKLIDKNIRLELKDSYSPGGNTDIKKKFMERYVMNVLEYDISRNDGFKILNIEEPVDDIILVGNKKVRVKGLIDRVDVLPDGSIVIIDYKSGSEGSFKGWNELFSREEPCRNGHIVQVLLYSMLWSEKNDVKVIPALYYIKNMGSGYDMRIKLNSGSRIENYSEHHETYSESLKQVLEEMLDRERPFYRDRTACEYCDFKTLCELR